MKVFDQNTQQWVSLRKTREYQLKKKIVRDLWLYASPIMLLLAFNWLLVFVLFLTFISFSILDESVYSYDRHE
ncbi:MAG: hypothetical protein OEZ58_02895 [Gammaproteobacteria bacterium]|nr:hypothetical protein [Gammaproteobacteria bacterium]MDH5727911.1 hypothetical protein [Gammaproteobacteria bacterium]